MEFFSLLVLLSAVGLVFLVRKLALVSAQDAVRHLKGGALVVDVRNPEEFNQSHVPGAINLPLGGLPGSISAVVPDKDRVLLLHCLGGGRSAVAQRLLRTKGYTRALNLGGYRRAERLARAGETGRIAAPV